MVTTPARLVMVGLAVGAVTRHIAAGSKGRAHYKERTEQVRRVPPSPPSLI